MNNKLYKDKYLPRNTLIILGVFMKYEQELRLSTFRTQYQK